MTTKKCKLINPNDEKKYRFKTNTYGGVLRFYYGGLGGIVSGDGQEVKLYSASAPRTNGDGYDYSINICQYPYSAPSSQISLYVNSQYKNQIAAKQIGVNKYIYCYSTSNNIEGQVIENNSVIKNFRISNETAISSLGIEYLNGIYNFYIDGINYISSDLNTFTCLSNTDLIRVTNGVFSKTSDYQYSVNGIDWNNITDVEVPRTNNDFCLIVKDKNNIYIPINAKGGTPYIKNALTGENILTLPSNIDTSYNARYEKFYTCGDYVIFCHSAQYAYACKFSEIFDNGWFQINSSYFNPNGSITGQRQLSYINGIYYSWYGGNYRTASSTSGYSLNWTTDFKKWFTYNDFILKTEETL